MLATGVEKHVWRIDAQTGERGITLANRGERVRLSFAPKSVQDGTEVELMTYASEYYVKGEGTHRVTPIYRVTVNGTPENFSFPLEIQYPEEELGKKSIWVWGDDDVWRKIPGQNILGHKAMKVTISGGITYLAVFADDLLLETGIASWYKYKNCHCAASPDYPKGTQLKVTNVANGKTVVVKVNDFGPDRAVHPDRIIDLDRSAFEHLASPSRGLIRVRVEPI